VETVPGVSGGTVALIVGVYTQIIDSAAHVVSALRRLATGPNRWAATMAELRQARWRMLVPLLIGMAIAIFTVAGFMADLVEDHPVPTLAAFFGMVLASVSIPLRMAGVSGIRWHHVCFGLIAAAAAFWLVSLPPTTV